MRRAEILFLDTYGAGLAVTRDMLLAGGEFYHPGAHNLSAIILAAPGAITTPAIQWLAEESIGLYIMHRSAFSVVTDGLARRLSRREQEARLRQMACYLDLARRLAAARGIVAAKIATLRLAPLAQDGLLAELACAQTVQDCILTEARAGAAYWSRWHGAELTFKGNSLVPEDWRTFQARPRSWRTGRLGEGEAQFSNRYALTPANSLLNYAGAIVVAQCTRALCGLGFDAAFGMLHAARPGMAALSWDVYELLRVKCEAAVFAYMEKRTFEQAEFKIEKMPRPHIRFGARIARELAELTLRKVPFADAVRAARKVAGLFPREPRDKF